MKGCRARRGRGERRHVARDLQGQPHVLRIGQQSHGGAALEVTLSPCTG